MKSKSIHKILILGMLLVLIFSLAACGGGRDKDGGDKGPILGKSLTPADIIQLPDLVDYGSKPAYYSPNPATYGDTNAERTKLQARIDDRRDDEDLDEASSVVKIFAHSDAQAIIEAMRLAAVPANKMTQVVDYLAGEETVEESEIIAKVDSGKWSATPGWSFFDDYDYYEKLQDRADLPDATDEDEDNVKRQYRNMAGKIFAIGMSGDEFARMFVEEMLYAIDVIESDKMANAVFNPNPADPSADAFWNYCKEELDYDTLVYILAFNDHYTASNGRAKSVKLYGYYYDYEKRVYDETNDDEFEKQLKYSHQKTFTKDEWLEYVDIQRNMYQGSYRYSDNFYQNNFYPAHLNFQELKEIRENTVYGIERHNNMSYTGEMRSGMTNGGFAGQLRMSDWLWCYGGDDERMTAYNQANTDYETGKNQGAENSARGEYYYKREQLKVANYLLTNMSNTELGLALRYQIYNYSSDMVKNIQDYKKDIRMYEVGKSEPEEYIFTKGYVAAGNVQGAKDYATGKIEALVSQMTDSLSNADIETKANKAASESWATMNREVLTALNEDNYNDLATFVEKVDRLDDLVIKRKWSCGAGIGEETTCTHGTCTKKYDPNHAISQFASNYSTILQRVSGNAVLTFKYLPSDKTNYNLNGAETGTTYAPRYHAIATGSNLREFTNEMLVSRNDYSEYEEITVERGNGFKEAIFDATIDLKDENLPAGTKEGENWWNTKSRPGKPKAVVEERIGQNRQNYTYTYSFVGWYLDANLLYKLEDFDEITCDLVLYAGYTVKKQ